MAGPLEKRWHKVYVTQPCNGILPTRRKQVGGRIRGTKGKKGGAGGRFC